MAYYDVANLVTVTKTNLIRRNALWLCKDQCCENRAPSLPLELHSGFGCFRSILQIWADVSRAPKFDHSISQIS